MTPNTSTADDIGMGRLGDEDDVAVPVTEFQVIPAGTYPVEFINYERMQTQFGESVKLQYRITEGAQADALVDEIASLKGGRNSKLKSRMGVLRGRPYAPGETIRPRELFGKTAQVYVTVKKVMGDDGEFEVNRIGDLTPLQGQGQPSPSGLRLARGLEEQPRQPEPPDSAWGTAAPPPAE